MVAMARWAGLWLLLCGGLAHAGWLKFAESAAPDGAGVIYYDPMMVARLADGKIGVWEKDVRSAASVIERRKKYGLPTARFENFAYTLQRIIIDCRQRQYAVVSVKDYSREGELLDVIDRSMSEWQFNDIAPGSITDVLMKRVCESE